MGCFLAAPLLVLWEWIRLRRGRASERQAASAGRVLVTAAVLCESLSWISALGFVSYNRIVSNISISAWYAAIPLSFVALVLFFSVRNFVRQPAFWACWINILAVGLMLLMLAGN
jgi:hypothetical protein